MNDKEKVYLKGFFVLAACETNELNDQSSPNSGEASVRAGHPTPTPPSGTETKRTEPRTGALPTGRLHSPEGGVCI